VYSLLQVPGGCNVQQSRPVYPTTKFVALLRTKKIGISFFPRVNSTNFAIFPGKKVIKFFLCHKIEIQDPSHMPGKKKKRAQYCLKTHNIYPLSVTTHV
jgi:hypothetical protein